MKATWPEAPVIFTVMVHSPDSPVLVVEELACWPEPEKDFVKTCLPVASLMVIDAEPMPMFIDQSTFAVDAELLHVYVSVLVLMPAFVEYEKFPGELQRATWPSVELFAVQPAAPVHPLNPNVPANKIASHPSRTFSTKPDTLPNQG